VFPWRRLGLQPKMPKHVYGVIEGLSESSKDAWLHNSPPLSVSCMGVEFTGPAEKRVCWLVTKH
jgi:hypothetical protein